MKNGRWSGGGLVVTLFAGAMLLFSGTASAEEVGPGFHECLQHCDRMQDMCDKGPQVRQCVFQKEREAVVECFIGGLGKCHEAYAACLKECITVKMPEPPAPPPVPSVNDSGDVRGPSRGDTPFGGMMPYNGGYRGGYHRRGGRPCRGGVGGSATEGNYPYGYGPHGGLPGGPHGGMVPPHGFPGMPYPGVVAAPVGPAGAQESSVVAEPAPVTAPQLTAPAPVAEDAGQK